MRETEACSYGKTGKKEKSFNAFPFLQILTPFQYLPASCHSLESSNVSTFSPEFVVIIGKRVSMAITRRRTLALVLGGA